MNPDRPADTPAAAVPPAGAAGTWSVHNGWEAPIWTDPDGQVVHLYDLAHAVVPPVVRARAVAALRLLIDPEDTGPRHANGTAA